MRSLIPLVVLSAIASVSPAYADENSALKSSDLPASTASEMIAVEVKLIEVSRSKLDSLGFEFSEFNGSSSNTITEFNDVPSGKVSELAAALVKNKLGRVLASPQVVTLAGEEATLSVGSQSKENLPGEMEADNHSMKMRIRPALIAGERVKLDLQLEWSGTQEAEVNGEGENQSQHFELRTTLAPKLGKAIVLARSLQLENGSDTMLIVVTPEILEATANGKDLNLK